MDSGLIVICALTFVIHLIGALAYSARIAGSRTGRLALTAALFNILALVSRTANSLQAPLVAKRMEENIAHVTAADAIGDFRWILAAASVATLVGALLIPTFQRLFGRYLDAFSEHRSAPRIVFRLFSTATLADLRETATLPRWRNVLEAGRHPEIPWTLIALNVGATALWTVGVLASLYAGYLRPELRVTSSQLSAVVNGFATIVMIVFIDPQVSIVADDVAQGRVSEGYFRRSIVWLAGSRLAGTLLAQVTLAPAAWMIAAIAERI